jgi:hypothetical protein
MTAKELKLDYFKVYDIENNTLQDRVLVQGQFDKDPDRALLLFMNHFANAVSKNGEPIFNKNAHLTWYAIQQDFAEPTRQIVAENQFGKQKFLIGRALFLLAPARKFETGSVAPKGLDHFKVYQVLEGQPVNRTIKLQDQFGADEVRVGPPLLFATPVKKQHAGATVAITNPKAHLVIYAITPRTLQKTVEVSDQFVHRRLHTLRSTWLAAPSLKSEWKQV